VSTILAFERLRQEGCEFGARWQDKNFILLVKKYMLLENGLGLIVSVH
jgi:hypothetical protein